MIVDKRPSAHADDLINYRDLLAREKIDFVERGFYLHVKRGSLIGERALHISATRHCVTQVVMQLLPVLTEKQLSFDLVRDKEVARLVAEGSLGYQMIGKVITVYVNDEKEQEKLATELISITADFKGPAIPNTTHLGGIIYATFVSNNEKPKPPIRRDVIPTLGSNLVKNYIITSVLKSDAKGGVYKGFYFKGILPRRCVIKEGKHDMCVDENGRDINDRLKWQYQVQSDLCDVIRMPRPIELFTENENTYLVMELIKGKMLKDVIDDIFESHCWLALSSGKRHRLILLQLQLVRIISSLHRKGYVHRDITHQNFMLDYHDRLALIDLELTFQLDASVLKEPFRLGTIGFMSPEQRDTMHPTIKEDIYGLGALMIVFFTKLFPTKLYGAGFPLRKDALMFLIGDEQIVDVILKCLADDPRQRPELHQIEDALLGLEQRVIRSSGEHKITLALHSREEIEKLIVAGLNGLLISPVKNPGHLWWSNKLEKTGDLSNLNVSQDLRTGLFSGVSGIMLTLARVSSTGIPLGGATAVYTQSVDFLRANVQNRKNNLSAGLYIGAAGIAVSIAEGIRCGLVEKTPDNLLLIEKLLDQRTEGLNLANGIAGHGISIIKCLSLLEREKYVQRLREYAGILVKEQKKDGSWVIQQPGQQPAKTNGLFYGIAGIIFYLVEYFKINGSIEIKRAIWKGLSYLQRKAVCKQGRISWKISNRDAESTYGVAEGTSGVAISFLKAYETFHQPVFKEMAEGALSGIDQYFFDPKFNLQDGLSGLGMTYLEAARTLGDSQWQERANWIFEVLFHASRRNEEHIYWICDETKLPTADWMLGNSGVVDFFACMYSRNLRFELT